MVHFWNLTPDLFASEAHYSNPLAWETEETQTNPRAILCLWLVSHSVAENWLMEGEEPRLDLCEEKLWTGPQKQSFSREVTVLSLPVGPRGFTGHHWVCAACPPAPHTHITCVYIQTCTCVSIVHTLFLHFTVICRVRMIISI